MTNVPNRSLQSARDKMTPFNSNIEENGKARVDYVEDLERDSSVKAVGVAGMERVEVTEDDVRSFFP